MMKRLLVLAAVLAIVLSHGPRIAFADSAKVKAAQEAAKAWLALVDAAQYDDSWNEASQMFKSQVPKSSWRRQVAKARGPLGALKSRELAGSKYATELPGAPDGEYVVLQYRSSFEKKKSAVETITPMLDADGKWHVSGYFIR
jgi:hypothetical protein